MDTIELRLLEAYKQLKDLPNVISVDFGKKIIDGELTTTPAIIIVVEKKDRFLAAEFRVPDTMFGIATDVVEKSRFEAKPFTINEDYIFVGNTGANGTQYCYDKDNNIVSCGGLDYPNLLQRQIHLYDNPGSPNHNGRIIQGGMAAVGVTPDVPAHACNSMCTLSMAVKDNVDGKLVLLGNQHCVDYTAPYLRKHRFNDFPLTYSKHIEKQNSRYNKNELPSSYWNNVKLIHPTRSFCADYTSGSQCNSLQIPCALDDIDGYKQIGSFKAAVFMPRNVNDTIAGNNIPINVEIIAPTGTHPVESGDYNLACWNTADGNQNLNTLPCLWGLTCLQREYINNTPGYSIIVNGETFDKVPECGTADCAIWSVPSPEISGTTVVIPLPGVVDLGEGPFEWATKAEVDALVGDIGNPVYIYKTGARRGTITDLQHMRIESTSHTFTVPISEFTPTSSGGDIVSYRYPIGPTIKCKAIGASPNILCEGGDSGSPVFVEIDSKLKLLGLLSWGDGDGAIMISPIWSIAEKLNISPWLDSTDLAIVNSSDTDIEIAERDFTISTPTSNPITHYKD
jgi:hypothetical protein